jgi:polyhydroxybutyrate depolymerase
MRRLIGAGVLAALAAVACGSSARAAEELRIDTKDGVRSAIVHAAKRQHAPTVIVLHGALISAEYTARWYGFAEAAKQHGFAAVFPRGTNLQWNDGRGTWVPGADDVAFLRRLAGELVSGRIADPARLYLVGVSSGGMLTFRMLCEAPELFAGAAAIIASMPAAVGARCRPKRAPPVLMFNGTADPIVPYRGGGVGFGGWQGRVWSAEGTAAFLARAYGCAAPSKARLAKASPKAIGIARFDWQGCNSGRGVTLYRVEGGGHQVFGHTNFFPWFLGPGTRRLSAPDVIMAAFARWGGGQTPFGNRRE